MHLLPWFFSKKKRFFQKIFFRTPFVIETHQWQNYPSFLLRRKVKVDVILPAAYYQQPDVYFPVLFLNDGQDLPALQLLDTLERGYKKKEIRPLIVVAIHAGDRMQEYGTAGQPDYKKRGAKAQTYTDFIFKELMISLRKRYRITTDAHDMAIAGFSLGGLSAFDIAWKHAHQFGKVGVFSGSLWWRSEAFRPEEPDANLIAHAMVQESPKKDGLKFWFQAGTADEKEDRNNNGLIDVIDDTLQLIALLKKKGYEQGRDIEYLEIKGGQHNPHTWGKAMPHFLKWAFGK
jgi:enterochelin esterase-like enzyme